MSILDTLSNIGVGGLSGFGDSYQQRGWYMPQFNYAGNGLAKNSMSYFANPNYRDYTSGGRALSSLFGNDKDNAEELEDTENQGYGSDSLFNSLGKLSSMGGKIGNWAANLRGSIAPNGKMLFSKMFNNIGDFGNRYQRVNPITNDVIA